MQLWHFLFGKNSSQAKVDAFSQFFTNWINFELQECLQTKILVDLRTLFDKSGSPVTSLYKVFDKAKLAEALKAYSAIERFTNTSVTHKNHLAKFSYTFKDINDTIEAIQKVIDEDDLNITTVWNIDYIMAEDLVKLDEKVQRVNLWETQHNISTP